MRKLYKSIKCKINKTIFKTGSSVSRGNNKEHDKNWKQQVKSFFSFMFCFKQDRLWSTTNFDWVSQNLHYLRFEL